jgi:hypothetical protein
MEVEKKEEKLKKFTETHNFSKVALKKILVMINKGIKWCDDSLKIRRKI